MEGIGRVDHGDASADGRFEVRWHLACSLIAATGTVARPIVSARFRRTVPSLQAGLSSRRNLMRTKLFALGMGDLVAGLLAAPVGVRADDDDTPGPIDSVQDLQDSGKIAFKMADVN